MPERVLVHPLLGWISGMCSDEVPHAEISKKVEEAKRLAHALEAERDALRRAIVEHRTAIHNTGGIRVVEGYEEVAEAKHRADGRLWSEVGDRA